MTQQISKEELKGFKRTCLDGFYLGTDNGLRLISAYEEQAKELERLKGIEELLDSANNAIEPLNDELDYERKENESLRNQLQIAVKALEWVRDAGVDYQSINKAASALSQIGKEKPDETSS